MSSIVKVTSKSGLIYAYESFPRWVPELGQSRPVKKYLGRYDPETGEIIPTTRKRKTDNNVTSGKSENDELTRYKEENKTLRSENKSLKKEIERLGQKISRYEETVSLVMKRLRTVK